MVRRTEAVFERGVLRPLEPLSLEESQHVFLTITELPNIEVSEGRVAEQEWIIAHGLEYAGQWVALQGYERISHGTKARAVRDEARRKGVDRPLLVWLPEEPGRSSAGWL